MEVREKSCVLRAARDTLQAERSASGSEAGESQSSSLRDLMTKIMTMKQEIRDGRKELGADVEKDEPNDPAKMTRVQRRKVNKRKAKELALTKKVEKVVVRDMERDIKLLTGVYEREIRITQNQLSEARNERRMKYYKKEMEMENEAFKKVVQTHIMDDEKLIDEKAKVEEALNLFKNRRGWKNYRAVRFFRPN